MTRSIDSFVHHSLATCLFYDSVLVICLVTLLLNYLMVIFLNP